MAESFALDFIFVLFIVDVCFMHVMSGEREDGESEMTTNKLAPRHM